MIDDLYREVIIDHNNNPRNFSEPSKYTHCGSEHNRLCGDKIQLWLSLENDTVSQVNFTGSGCALSTASASIMTEKLKGMSVSDIKNIFEKFHGMLTNDGDIEDEKLMVFSGVREYPMRVKCVTMCWHLVNKILSDLEN